MKKVKIGNDQKLMQLEPKSPSNKYIYHSMRYLFGIYKELIKCGLQSNSDKIVLYRSIYGISSELDITRIYMNTVK